jgi:tetratricopeptide (TPR) repeat protein
MGRQSSRQQLALEELPYLLQMIDLFGRTKSTEATESLIKLLQSPIQEVQMAAMSALERIGDGAGTSLVKSIARGRYLGNSLARTLLKKICQANKTLKTDLAATYTVKDHESLSLNDFLDRLIAQARSQISRQIEFEIEGAFQQIARNRYRAAFIRLDKIYSKNPVIYMKSADRISRAYFEYGRKLYTSGNYDEAKKIMLNALQVRDNAKARELLALIKLALAEGYVELGQREKAQAELKKIDAPAIELERLNKLRIRIYTENAGMAIAEGNYVRARHQLDRAFGIDPNVQGLHRKYATIFMYENLVPIGVLTGLFLALLTAIFIRVRQSFDRQKFVRIQSQIDDSHLSSGDE